MAPNDPRFTFFVVHRSPTPEHIRRVYRPLFLLARPGCSPEIRPTCWVFFMCIDFGNSMILFYSMFVSDVKVVLNFTFCPYFD